MMSDTETDLLDAVNAYAATGSKAQAAIQLRIPRTTLRNRLDSADAKGIKPTVPITPPENTALALFGTSTLRNADGDIVLEWEKRKADNALVHQRIRAVVAGLIEPVRGLNKPIKPPTHTNADLLVEYLLADVHLALYCWAVEGGPNGKDWDLEIARRSVCEAFDRLLIATPNAKTALINNLGDYFHVDNSFGTTAAGTRLDYDSRYFKMITVGIEVMRYCIDRALQKHEKIILRVTGGNHDTHSIVAMVTGLLGRYEAEPRVTIEADPTPFWAMLWHSVLIGTAHGDDPRPPILPKLMAVDYPEYWAKAKHKYIRHGHFHIKSIFEDMGVEVECVRTLAPNDAWHNKKGYRSKKSMQAIVHHKDEGEIERHTAGALLNDK